MSDKQSVYSPPILHKAFAVLEEVAQNQSELGISDLARSLSISKSTIYGITYALIELGALRQDAETKKFRLGPTLVKLGSQVLAGVDLRIVARPFLEELCQEFKETVFMGSFNENAITIIEKAESPQDLKISAPIGTRISIFAGASGKIFLADLNEQQLDEILLKKPLPKFTEKTITDLETYRNELKQIRKQGYATDFEEYINGVNAVGVPIFNTWGSLIAAIWMVGFNHSFNEEKINKSIQAAINAAARIKDRLGG